jgi:hypothetical protein
VPAAGASITVKAYGLFSLAAEPSVLTVLPMAVVSRYSWRELQYPDPLFSASPVTKTCTGLPLVVMLALITVAGSEVLVVTVTLLPSVWA